MSRDNVAVGLERPETPHQRAERLTLERGAARSPLRGRPLPRRPRLGPPTLEGYLAALGGPLPYMARLRAIEDHTERHISALGAAWQALARASPGHAERFALAWRAVAASWDFREVNDLIDRHNRYYPIEARLPMDPRRQDFALVDGRPYVRSALGPDWVLERFPPALERAIA